MRANVLARTLRAVAAGLGATVLAIPASAIDLTGSWTIFIDGSPSSVTISQNSGDLTVTLDTMTLQGTIDPGTGQFSVIGAMPPECGGLFGTATADSNSIDGFAQFGEIVCPGGILTCTCENFVTSSLRGCRTDGGAACCSDGVVDATEQCDDGPGAGSPCCDSSCQFVAAGTTCRTGAGECDTAETCTGNSGACPNDVAIPAGVPCTDDGNLCTGDACDGAGACAHSPALDTSCGLPNAPAAAKIRILNRDEPNGDSLAFRWKKGPETPADDFGVPTASTAYALCVYDETAGPGTATLKLQADVPAGGTCAGGPCWEATSKGFAYYNPDATPHGLKRLRLVAREDGKAKIAAAGRGPNLTLSPSAYAPKITVQLKASNGGCWGASFSTPSTNSDAKLRAKSD